MAGSDSDGPASSAAMKKGVQSAASLAPRAIVPDDAVFAAAYDSEFEAVWLYLRRLGVPEADVETCRKTFLDRHPEASTYAGFADFGFFRLEPTHVRYVGGFGRMSWVDAKSYADAWA